MNAMQQIPVRPADGAVADCHECRAADLVSLERTRWFARQLVGPDDLTQDQRYFRERHRRHNRLMHGWGIACGLRVRSLEGCQVAVEPGYALGPHGDEILLGDELVVDACSEDLDGNALCSPPDPWCAGVTARRPAGRPVYLAIRACEQPARPVRVVSCGCGCDEGECEYSRVRDGVAVKVLTDLPDGYADPLDPPPFAGFVDAISCTRERRGACPPCPADPWVVLADIWLEGDRITDLECDPHRRYVVSFASSWFACVPAKAGAEQPPFEWMAAEALAQHRGGYASLVAERGAFAPEVPTASVAIRLGEQWTSVPAAFEVHAGDTLGDVLARAGDTTYHDPATGAAYKLSELYAAAGADPAAKVSTVSAALAPLEGRRLDPDGLRVVQASLDRLLDADGSERLITEHAGSPAGVPSLPAVEIAGVAPDSAVGKHVGNSTVAEVAAQPLDAFADAASANVPANRRAAARTQAETVHEAASRLVRLAAQWAGG